MLVRCLSQGGAAAYSLNMNDNMRGSGRASACGCTQHKAVGSRVLQVCCVQRYKQRRRGVNAQHTPCGILSQPLRHLLSIPSLPVSCNYHHCGPWTMADQDARNRTIAGAGDSLVLCHACSRRARPHHTAAAAGTHMPLRILPLPAHCAAPHPAAHAACGRPQANISLVVWWKPPPARAGVCAGTLDGRRARLATSSPPPLPSPQQRRKNCAWLRRLARKAPHIATRADARYALRDADNSDALAATAFYHHSCGRRSADTASIAAKTRRLRSFRAARRQTGYHAGAISGDDAGCSRFGHYSSRRANA